MTMLLVCSIQFSHTTVSDSATPWTAARQASLSIVNSWSSPKRKFILCRPLLLLPSIFPGIRVFSNESALRIRWPKYWFQLQHQSFQWTPRTDLLQDGLVGSPCVSRNLPYSAFTPSATSQGNLLDSKLNNCNPKKPAILGLLQIPVTHEALKSPPALLQTEASGFTSTPAS